MMRTLSRIKIFNWFACGLLVLTPKKDEAFATSHAVSSVTLTSPGMGYSGASKYGSGSHVLTLPNFPNTPVINMTNSSINFNVTHANGGWIVQVNKPTTPGLMSPDPDLYVINDDAEFDNALGKIVTTALLKA
jgi:hypothetical protein